MFLIGISEKTKGECSKNVAIELATIESSTAHDRTGRAKAGTHDSVASYCVATEEGMHA